MPQVTQLKSCSFFLFDHFHNAMTQSSSLALTIGVLALQGAFSEHVQLLRQAELLLKTSTFVKWTFEEIRTPEELERCDALIIPGGESTTISLVAQRSGMLEPLREFVKYVHGLNQRC
jgi:5'-phosphate synthase pdxT subunit